MSSQPLDPRLDRIVEVLLRFTKRDFSVRAPVSDELDHIDAIASGLNMMAESLDGEVASRAELEKAHRELKETQSKMIHSAKLAAAGQLASGVAHEINNPVGWVSLSAGIALRRIGEVQRQIAEGRSGADFARLREATDEVDVLLRHITEGIERIRAVVGDLRRFSGVDQDEVELVAMGDVVHAMCNLAAPSVRGKATFALSLGEVDLVSANRGRLGQMVTNLVLNAAQAMEAAGTYGEIRIITGKCADPPGGGDGVLLVVEDDGPGVPEDLRERIFEAFFTTRTNGTGLGLVVVRDIVTRYGGEIRVRDGSKPGARFEVRFPAAKIDV